MSEISRILKAWQSDELPADIPVRRGKNARPTAKHVNRKKEAQRGKRKHRSPYTDQ